MMLRDCKTIPDIIRSIEGDKNRKSSVLKLNDKPKTYHFRNPDWIKGALLIIEVLEDNSSEMHKLFRGLKGREKEVIKDAVPVKVKESGSE